MAEEGAVRAAHEVPAEARDVGLEGDGLRESRRLDLLQRERQREAQGDVVAGEPLLDRFGDRVGREGGAGVAVELRGGLRRRAPGFQRVFERSRAAELSDVFRRVLAGEDAGADDLVAQVERHEHVARTGVAENRVGVGGGGQEPPEAVAGLVLDEERLARARLHPAGLREEGLGVGQAQARQRRLRDRGRALQQQGGEQQSPETPASDQPGADAGRNHRLLGED